MRKLAFVAVGIGLLGGLFFLFARQPPPQRAEYPEEAARILDLRVSAPSTRRSVVDLTVQGGKLKSGPTIIKLVQGQSLTIRIIADRSDELHLHGYDLHLVLSPNETATLAISAEQSGRFTYELHQANMELGAIEVYPP
jgi:hypothetical protein